MESFLVFHTAWTDAHHWAHKCIGDITKRKAGEILWDFHNTYHDS